MYILGPPLGPYLGLTSFLMDTKLMKDRMSSATLNMMRPNVLVYRSILQRCGQLPPPSPGGEEEGAAGRNEESAREGAEADALIQGRVSAGQTLIQGRASAARGANTDSLHP